MDSDGIQASKKKIKKHTTKDLYIIQNKKVIKIAFRCVNGKCPCGAVVKNNEIFLNIKKLIFLILFTHQKYEKKLK